MKPRSSYLTVTDQFCGAGGFSLSAWMLGFEVQLALNHWRLAIETHQANFPKTLHDCTDISAADPRRYFPTDILITSPECTNHSLAKGKARYVQPDLFGKAGLDPSEERSRATMWDVPRFAEFHNYRRIIVENVVDARKWRLWHPWWHAMRTLGYEGEVVYLNSMFAHLNPYEVREPHDFAPQSRDRMYVVFWKRGDKKPNLDFRPLGYCLHCEKDVEAVQSWRNQFRWGRYGRQYDYRCPVCAQIVKPYHFGAINAIDFSKPIGKIADRPKPLKEKTLDRIEAGLEKFLRPMVTDLAHTHSTHLHSVPLDVALQTQTSAQTLALVMPFLIATNHSDDRRPISLTEALPTQTSRAADSLIIPAMLTMRNYDTKGYSDPYYRVAGLNEPLSTQVATATQDWVFGLQIHLRNNEDAAPLSKPMNTITAGGNHTAFLMSYYGNAQYNNLAAAMPTIVTKDRHALVEALGVKLEDCYFRMLQPDEIGLGMGFPSSYVVLGNKRNQVRQYGNAVTPVAPKQILRRCMETFQ